MTCQTSATTPKTTTQSSPSESSMSSSSSSSSSSTSHAVVAVTVPETFPSQLYQMLQDAITQKFDDIVCWVPSGDGFKIHSKLEFEKEIIPKYFKKQTKCKSFLRQLNMYGFYRVTSGPNRGCYYHKIFQRNNPSGCQKLRRPTRNKDSISPCSSSSSAADAGTDGGGGGRSGGGYSGRSRMTSPHATTTTTTTTTSQTSSSSSSSSSSFGINNLVSPASSEVDLLQATAAAVDGISPVLNITTKTCGNNSIFHATPPTNKKIPLSTSSSSTLEKMIGHRSYVSPLPTTISPSSSVSTDSTSSSVKSYDNHQDPTKKDTFVEFERYGFFSSDVASEIIATFGGGAL